MCYYTHLMLKIFQLPRVLEGPVVLIHVFQCSRVDLYVSLPNQSLYRTWYLSGKSISGWNHYGEIKFLNSLVWTENYYCIDRVRCWIIRNILAEEIKMCALLINGRKTMNALGAETQMTGLTEPPDDRLLTAQLLIF